MPTKHRIASPATVALLGVAIVFLASSCGQSTSSATVPTPHAAPSPTPAASPPPGGPVPAELLGDWFLPPAAVLDIGYTCPSHPNDLNCFADLTFTATTYQVVFHAIAASPPGHGDVVVNNDEIDFFNGVQCGLQLPDGVGRFKWTLTSGVLHLVPLNQDPCRRNGLAYPQGWSRTA
jgi:hypothetical protein